VFPKNFKEFAATSGQLIELKRKKLKTAKLVLVAAFFLFLGVTLIRSSEDTGTVFMGWVCVFFFVPALITALSVLISNSPAVSITPNQLIIHWVFGRKIMIEWPAIQSFQMSVVSDQSVITLALKDPGKDLRNAQGLKHFFLKLNPRKSTTRSISSSFVKADFNELYPFLLSAITP
jgi:hypothetical protein